MKVVETRDKEVIQPGTLYFAGPGYHLTESLDHLTGSGVAFLAVEHHHPGRRHVECQAHER